MGEAFDAGLWGTLGAAYGLLLLAVLLGCTWVIGWMVVESVREWRRRRR